MVSSKQKKLKYRSVIFIKILVSPKVKKKMTPCDTSKKKKKRLAGSYATYTRAVRATKRLLVLNM